MQCLKNISLYKYLFTRKRENKAYLLKVESKQILVYCHMEAAELGECGGGGWTLVMKTDGEKVAAAMQQFLPSQGFRPEGEIPRRHSSNSRILRKVLTAGIYSQYARKNLDLLHRGREESVGDDHDVSIVCARKYEMVRMT